MPDHRQKSRAKQKKKRAGTGRAAVSYTSPSVIGQAEKQLAAQLPAMPLGPCFITRGWQSPSQPRLQCMLVTRYIDESTVVPAAILVDLGCEGVRDAYFARPTPVDGLPELLTMMQRMFPRGFEEVSPERASAIVEQAIKYAAEIGLEVPAKAKPVLGVLSEEREAGFEVEMGRKGKPLYAPQPGEDTKAMVIRLVKAVGPDGFTVELPPKDPPEGDSKA